MGCYNTIVIPCPECGTTHEFQTKSGSCGMKTYHISNVPLEDFAGIVGDSVECEKCGTVFGVPEETKPRQNLSHLVTTSKENNYD